MGIYGRLDLLLFHDFCDFPELRAVGTDKYKPVFLALFFSGLVIFAACQRKEQFFQARKLLALGKCFVGAGSQAHQPPTLFQHRQFVFKLVRT